MPQQPQTMLLPQAIGFGPHGILDFEEVDEITSRGIQVLCRGADLGFKVFEGIEH